MDEEVYEELDNDTRVPELELVAFGRDLEEGEDQPLTDGERTVMRPVQSLVEATAEARVVRVRVFLHQAVSHDGVLVEDQLLHQLVDGEHPHVGGATSFLQHEVGDELSSLQILLFNKQDGHLAPLFNLQEGEHLAKNFLHVLLETREIGGEAMGSPGKLDDLVLVSNWKRVQGRDELEMAYKLNFI